MRRRPGRMSVAPFRPNKVRSVQAKLSCFLLVKMPACSAPGCKNRPERYKERGLSFHRLPTKNITLAKKWLEQLRRDEKRVPKNLYVCNEHFTDDCFETGYRFELLGGRTRRRSLKKDAFPTIFQRKGPVKAEKRIKEVVNLLLETKHSSAECKEILEDGKGKDSSNAVQNVVNEYASAVTFKQVKNVANTENQVPSSSSPDDMVVGKEIAHGDVKVHTLFQIPVRRSASAVTYEQDVKIAGTVNHVIDSRTHVAKMKVASTENQLVSSAPTDDMVVKKEISHGDVKVDTPLRIPVWRSVSASTSKQEDMEIGDTVNRFIDIPTHMTKMKVTSRENQVFSSAPTDDMVIKKEISHGDVKVYTPLQIPVSRSVTSKQGVEIAGAVTHVIDSPTHMAKRVPDCMLVEDTSPYKEVEMHNPVQAQEPLSAVASESAGHVATVEHVFTGPVHIIEIVTNMDKMHVQSVHVDVGMQTDPLSECSPMFDTITLCMKRKLVEQDHSYCKKKLEPLPKQPECTTNHDVKDEAEQNIDSSDDDWEDEISETDIDCDSDEDWIPEDEEFDSDDEEFDSDEEDLHVCK